MLDQIATKLLQHPEKSELVQFLFLLVYYATNGLNNYRITVIKISFVISESLRALSTHLRLPTKHRHLCVSSFFTRDVFDVLQKLYFVSLKWNYK